MTIIHNNEFSERIRKRDLVRVRDIPELTEITSHDNSSLGERYGEADEASSGLLNAPEGKKKWIRRPTPRYQNSGESRHDELERHDRIKADGMDRVDASDDDDDMGVDGETSRGDYGSSQNSIESGEIDDRGTLSSDESRLDYPLDQLSGSGSATYANVKATSTKPHFTVAGHNSPQSPDSQGAAIMTAIENSLQSSENLKRNRALSVDVKAAPAPRHSLEDAHRTDTTPVTSNASARSKEKGSSFSLSPTSLSFLKSKKKEGVANTLATVVQEIHSSIETPKPSASADADDDSSAAVDARWEKLRAKYIVDSQPSRVDGVDANSEDVNERDLRDSLLDVNYQSPTVFLSCSSETFEDDLIQDCVDTGLPSPTKQQGNDSECSNHSDEPSQSSSRTPMHANLLSKECTTKDLLKAARKCSFFSFSTDNGVLSRNAVGKFPPNAVEQNTSPKLEDEIEGHEEALTKKSLIGQIDEDIPKTKIEIALMPSESNDSQSLSDVSHSSCAEAGHCVDKPRDKISEDGQNRALSSPSRRGLSWWKKNGRILVNERLQKSPPLMTKGYVKSSGNINKVSSEPKSNVGTSPEEIHQRWKERNSHSDDLGSKPGFESSISDCSSTGNEVLEESAFKRGLSVFGQRNNSKRHTSPQKATADIQSSLKTLPNNSDADTKESAEGHHLNPNIDSPNSFIQGRGPSTTSRMPNTVDIIEKRIVSRTPWTGGSTGRGKLFRPRHEDSSAGGALGLTPSPRPRDHLETSSSVLNRRMKRTKPGPTDTADDEDRKVKNTTQVSRQEGRSVPLPNQSILKKLILTGPELFLEDENRVSPGQSQADESEFAAQILNVTLSLSSLSGETTVNQYPPESAFDKQRNQPVVPGIGHKHVPGVECLSSSTRVPSWRKTPSESLADFTIHVHCTGSNAPVLYNVHKHILGVGPRRSELLREIFRSSPEAFTKITLVDESMIFVPYILDFVYCHDLEIVLTTENVMAYRYLAEHFKISPIIAQTAKFILDDLKIENMSTYISDSSRYNDDTITKLIASSCGEKIHSIKTSDLLWSAMDPALFLRVISCPKLDRKTVSRHISVLLVEYHKLHSYEMDLSIFLEMTSVSLVPLIDSVAAIPLLEICHEYGAPISLQSLQKRCAYIVAYHWKTTSDMDRQRIFSLLRSLPSNFTVDFLVVVETGKGTALSDPDVSNVLRELSHTHQHNDYESAASFTLDKLCGKREGTLQGDLDRPLSWKMAPDHSFSDWMVKVKHKHDGTLDVYHVHKHMLSIGDHSSALFAKTFLSEDHETSITGSTMIELSQATAQLVPVVLDFMYSPVNELVITSTTATALRFLSRVFDIWLLNKKVVDYVENDMDFANMLVYLEQAEMYDDERIMNIAVQRCATGIREITPESEILYRIKPEFFGRVVASGLIDKTASCHINILIAKYFTLHDLNEKLLAELLKQVPMKAIDLESALVLLDVMSPIESKEVSIFDKIRERCAKLLIDNWKTVRTENREMAFRTLPSLDAALVAEIFEVVEGGYHEELTEAMSVQSRLVKRYRAQLEEAETLRRNEIARIKEETEYVIAELLKKVDALETELAGYEDATNRRAMRSCGLTRLPSPKRSWNGSPQSNIPRLNTPRKSTPASPASQREKMPLQQLRLPSSRLEAPSRRTPKVVAPSEKEGSLFGNWFGCHPENPSEEEIIDLHTKAIVQQSAPLKPS